MWEKIGIGAGFMLTALSFWVINQNIIAIILFIIGAILILHGIWDRYFKPKIFLKQLIERALLKRSWVILSIDKKKYEQTHHFVITAQRKRKRGQRVTISRSKEHGDFLMFYSRITTDGQQDSQFAQFTQSQKDQLLGNIRLFLASKNAPFAGIEWPLDRVRIEKVLPINSHISEQAIADAANEVVFSVVGIVTLIRQSLAPLTTDKEGSKLEHTA
jgi:hypothetical protein